MAEQVEDGAGVAQGERRALRLQEAAVRHGAYRWVERRLFELTGSWASAPGLPDEARVLLFEASAQHAWHADLWRSRLPLLAGVDHERLTRPIGAAVEPLLESLAPDAWHGGEETAGRRFLVGLVRVVLPRLLVSYRRFAERLQPVADGPAIRALTLVVRDEEEEVAAAEAVVGPLLADRRRAHEAAEWTRVLDRLAVHGEAGDDPLLPWPEGNSPS